MGDLLSKLLPLSIGAAFSPTVLGVILVILSGRRAVARGASYMVAVLLVLAGLTVLGLYGVRQSAPSAGAVETEHVVDAIAGALLLLLALGTVVRHLTRLPTPSDTPTKADVDGQPGLGTAFLLGLAMMLTNFSTILLYLPAMHVIVVADVDRSNEAVAVAIAYLITSLPATAPFVFRIAAPATASRVFGRLHGFIQRHQMQIGIAVEVVFGVWLVVKALR